MVVSYSFSSQKTTNGIFEFNTRESINFSSWLALKKNKIILEGIEPVVEIRNEILINLLRIFMKKFSRY